MLLVAHDGDHEYALREAGSVLTLADEGGYEVVPISAAERRWPDPSEFTVIVVLGSGRGAWDGSLPWLDDELTFLRRVIEVGTPMLAICFGAQALARAIGGAAESNIAPEHGITRITVADSCPLPAGPWFEMHSDRCVVPDDAEVLASTPSAIQLFGYGPHLGVQFHPEITPGVFALWASSMGEAERATYAALGVDHSALAADIEANRDALVDGYRAVWAYFLDRAARVGRAQSSPAEADLV